MPFLWITLTHIVRNHSRIEYLSPWCPRNYDLKILDILPGLTLDQLGLTLDRLPQATGPALFTGSDCGASSEVNSLFLYTAKYIKYKIHLRIKYEIYAVYRMSAHLPHEFMKV